MEEMIDEKMEEKQEDEVMRDLVKKGEKRAPRTIFSNKIYHL